MGNNDYAAALMSLLLGPCTPQGLDANRHAVFSAIPELSGSVGLKQNNPYHNRDLWQHTVYAVSQVPQELPLRMAALLHDVGKIQTRTTDEKGIDHFYGHAQKSVHIAAEVLKRLGVSKAEAEEILSLIALHDIDIELGTPTWHRMKKQYSASFLSKLLLLKRADILAQNPEKLGCRLADLQTLRVDLL